MSRHGSFVVVDASVADDPVTPTRVDMIRAYDEMSSELTRLGSNPLVSSGVLEVFSDGELRAIIRETTFQVVRLRRALREQTEQ